MRKLKGQIVVVLMALLVPWGGTAGAGADRPALGRPLESLTLGDFLRVDEAAEKKALAERYGEIPRFFSNCRKNAQGFQECSLSVAGKLGTDPVVIWFVRIPGGRFFMGTPDGSGKRILLDGTSKNDDPRGKEKGRYSDEGPVHQVELPGFWMGRTEVTQAQWQALMGDDVKPYFKNCGPDCPMECVSWIQAIRFCNALSQTAGLDSAYDGQGNSRKATGGFRLPSEAQWEYGARAGSEDAFANGGISETGCGKDANLVKMGWYCNNSDNRPHPVADLDPNGFGLYDMHGDVYEWCEDDWHSDYDGAPNDGSAWIDSPRGGHRVIRGGSWHNRARRCRAGFRDCDTPGYRNNILGFRLVLPQVSKSGGQR